MTITFRFSFLSFRTDFKPFHFKEGVGGSLSKVTRSPWLSVWPEQRTGYNLRFLDFTPLSNWGGGGESTLDKSVHLLNSCHTSRMKPSSLCKGVYRPPKPGHGIVIRPFDPRSNVSRPRRLTLLHVGLLDFDVKVIQRTLWCSTKGRWERRDFFPVKLSVVPSGVQTSFMCFISFL